MSKSALAVMWRQHGLRIVFSAAVVLLIALSSWWFAFLRQAIAGQQTATLAMLDREVELAAIRAEPPARAGPLVMDRRMEIVAAGSPLQTPAHWLGDGADVRAGTPGRERRWLVQPTANYLQTLSDHFERRRAMVLGEGGLLTSLLVVVVAMLYTLSRAESRFRREMQDFLGRVTHEMKTPLAGIKAVLDTLKAGRMPADQQTALVTLALREAEREEHLIQNLLLAQRLRLPNQQFARERVALRPLLERFAAHRTETLGDAVTFDVNCAPEVAVTGDATALWTVLENLVDNAVKYGGKIIELSAIQAQDRVTLRVSDDGSGFEAHRAPDLFEPFARSQGPQVGKHGTGLGLSISRGLVERMGGTIAAHSQGLGHGAEFSVLLRSA